MIGKMDKKKLEELRKIRAYAIIAKGDTPKIVNEETFILPSQSNPEIKYTVVHHKAWECSCLDYQKTGLRCKHIQAIEMWLKLRDSIDDNILELQEEISHIVCNSCGSENIIKHGKRKTKNGEKQRYMCKDCKNTFVIEKIKGHKANAKLIALTMDLYFKGLSLRKISDTIYQFYDIELHHETIRRWINKFMGKIRKYANELEPNVGDIWHIDEQKIKVNGEWFYSWNILDEKTRFLIANAITKDRSIMETEIVMKKAKKNTGTPTTIITDGMRAYPTAIKNEFDDVIHISGVGIRGRINNNVLERYHGTYRERDKVMRGLETIATAKEMNENMRVYYNFIRGHNSLNGLTPSEIAGIDLNLGKNKWLGLISQAL